MVPLPDLLTTLKVATSATNGLRNIGRGKNPTIAVFKMVYRGFYEPFISARVASLAFYETLPKVSV
jgi:hypothetical protein